MNKNYTHSPTQYAIKYNYHLPIHLTLSYLLMSVTNYVFNLSTGHVQEIETH